MADLQTLRLTASTGGHDTSSAPEAVSSTHAAKLTNLLVARSGMLRLRAPLQYGSDALTSPKTTLRGTIGRGFNVLFPRTSGAGVDQAMVGVSEPPTVTNATYATAISTAGPSCEVGDFAYAINADGGGQGIIQWVGTIATPVFLTNAPYRPRAVCQHLGRLFVLGGTVPGAGSGSTAYPDRLYWTDIGGTPTDALLEWSDDVSGLVNQIDLDLNSDDVGQGLAKVGRNLALLSATSVWLLTGDTPATFAAHRVVSGVGARNYTPTVETADGCFFVSSTGLYYFDGATVTEVSKPVARDLATALNSGAGNGNIASLAVLDDQWLILCVGAVYCQLVYLPTLAWSTLLASTSIWAGGQPLMVGNVGVRAWAYDGSRVWTIGQLSQSTGNYNITRDEVVTSGLLGTDSSPANAIAAKATPASWWTRMLNLAAPMQKVQLHRVVVDYDLRVTGTAIAAGQGLTISLVDSLGTVLMAATDLPAGTTRQRATFDSFPETSDVQVRIEYANTAATNVTKLELYDCYIEYQVTRQRT